MLFIAPTHIEAMEDTFNYQLLLFNASPKEIPLEADGEEWIQAQRMRLVRACDKLIAVAFKCPTKYKER